MGLVALFISATTTSSNKVGTFQITMASKCGIPKIHKANTQMGEMWRWGRKVNKNTRNWCIMEIK
jgi:hypothetical protein